MVSFVPLPFIGVASWHFSVLISLINVALNGLMCSIDAHCVALSFLCPTDVNFVDCATSQIFYHQFLCLILVIPGFPYPFLGWLSVISPFSLPFIRWPPHHSSFITAAYFGGSASSQLFHCQPLVWTELPQVSHFWPLVWVFFIPCVQLPLTRVTLHCPRHSMVAYWRGSVFFQVYHFFFSLWWFHLVPGVPLLLTGVALCSFWYTITPHCGWSASFQAFHCCY